MPHQTTLNRLVHAELQYAKFNAVRTTKDCDAIIEIESNDVFASIRDSSRPASSYNNRAVCKQASSLELPSLDLLPLSANGIEVPPSSLTDLGGKHLLGRGFRPAYALCYLSIDPHLAPAIAESFTGNGRSVSRLAHHQTDEFFDLLQMEGVDFPPEKRERKRGFYCTEQFVAFVGKDDAGKSCAWATLHLHSGVGFLGNAFTLPSHRGSGFQSALLSARLQHAKASGASVVYTDVEHESQSHQNCERAGMRTVTINTIWSRDV